MRWQPPLGSALPAGASIQTALLAGRAFERLAGWGRGTMSETLAGTLSPLLPIVWIWRPLGANHRRERPVSSSGARGSRAVMHQSRNKGDAGSLLLVRNKTGDRRVRHRVGVIHCLDVSGNSKSHIYLR
ncbi:hypothetical protein AAFF_G00058610 [Aldrovandia affinis]|uniref:Uncharacterized protein n=1 Tax=Aldrovandia affinis TaxID=143900 RepID=A0AAD7WE33_9TELE|nr:hypothetical protein AAFF_G00058610 [Aldrovandia affinis]